MNERPIYHLDLFSGIGGFALAAQWCGIQTIAFVEKDEAASRILAHHFPGIRNLKDVTKLCLRCYDCEQYESDDSGEIVWCHRCEAEFGDCECIGTDAFVDEYGFPDLITGGVPCQPASLLGAPQGGRLGTADERWLWPDTIRIVSELMPRYCVFENPTAILTLEQGRAWNGIVSDFHSLGYAVWWEVIPAAAVGCGHLRERVILVCANPDSKGLEGHTWNETGGLAKKPVRSASEKIVCPISYQAEQWSSAEPDLRPCVDGLPPWLVEASLRCVGNAIVPQVAAVILKSILDYENQTHTH